MIYAVASKSFSPILCFTQALPPGVANASREDLQRMLMDSLRKTKARDKRIADLTTEKEALAKAQAAAASEAPAENGNGSDDLQHELQASAHLWQLQCS